MEVLSPPSAAVDTPGGLQIRAINPPSPKRLVPTAAAGRTGGAPSIARPLPFILTGVLCLLVGTSLLIARPDLLATYHYNQYIIAVTHLFVLGFLCTIAMGAMYQLVPVALETRLHSPRLVRAQFVAHTAGFAGMVWMFWVWDMKQVGHFGSLLALGAGWFVYNIARTLRTVPRWTVAAAGITGSLTWLSLTILAGLYLACAKCWDFSPFDPIAAMHAHAHLGIVGIFVQLILAVSLKLVPMFALSQMQNARRAGWSLGLLNIGLLGAVTAILLQSGWKFVFGLVMAAGLALYGLELRAILRARRRRELDWGLKYFLTALALLVPLSALGLFLAWPTLPPTMLTTQLENLYGYLGILGVAGFAVVGMLYKIVPFLIWYRVYSHRIGTARLPMLADLYSTAFQAAGYWTYLGALAVTSTGIVLASERIVQFGSMVLGLSLAVFLVNLGRILTHLVRPRIGPAAAPADVASLRPSLAAS